MTCRAVEAAMRPKPAGVSSNSGPGSPRCGRSPSSVGGEQVALLAGPHDDVTGLAVELDAGDALAAVGAVVGHEQRLLDGRDEHVEADVALSFEGAQGCEVDVHQMVPFQGGRLVRVVGSASRRRRRRLGVVAGGIPLARR